MVLCNTDFISCRQVLNIMVILGFIFNYMLRVNLTIAVVDMVKGEGERDGIEETRFDWTETMKNDVLGSFFWGYILTELPGGRLAEIVGATKIFGAGMMAASILTILLPAACYSHFYVVLVARALTGFSLGATWPALPPMAAKWIPPLERSKFVSNMMASALGGALTLPVCGYLIPVLGWASTFYVTGVIGLVWSILWFVLIYESPAKHPRISPEERNEIETAITAGAGGKDIKPKKVPWAKLLTSVPVWAIIITHTCSVYGYFTLVNEMPSYMKEVLHFNIKANGLFSSLPFLGKYIMAVAASCLADKILRSGRLSVTTTRKMLTAFAVFIPSGFMVMQAIWGYNQYVSITMFTCTLLFNGAVTGGYLPNGLDIAPHFSGTIFGLANTFSSIGGWTSTKIVGTLTSEESTFTQWKFVFWNLAVMYFIGASVFTLFGSGEIQPWNAAVKDASDLEKAEELKPLKDKEQQVKIV